MKVIVNESVYEMGRKEYQGILNVSHAVLN